MKRVLCRFCGTRDHHPSEMHLCKAMVPAKSVRKRETVEPAFLDVPSVAGDEESASEVAVSEPVDIPDAPSSSKERVERARKALTRAEISRRQRERDPEGYKKANRARMQRNRRKGC